MIALMEPLGGQWIFHEVCETYAKDDDLMALGAMVSDKGLEGLEFSGFILRTGGTVRRWGRRR